MLAEEVSMINIAEAVVMIESVEMTSEFFIFHLSLFTIRVFAVRTLVEEIRLISTVRVIRAVWLIKIVKVIEAVASVRTVRIIRAVRVIKTVRQKILFILIILSLMRMFISDDLVITWSDVKYTFLMTETAMIEVETAILIIESDMI